MPLCCSWYLAYKAFHAGRLFVRPPTKVLSWYHQISAATGPLVMTYSIVKRFSHARFQWLTSAMFVGTIGASVFVKTVVG